MGLQKHSAGDRPWHPKHLLLLKGPVCPVRGVPLPSTPSTHRAQVLSALLILNSAPPLEPPHLPLFVQLTVTFLRTTCDKMTPLLLDSRKERSPRERRPACTRASQEPATEEALLALKK